MIGSKQLPSSKTLPVEPGSSTGEPLATLHQPPRLRLRELPWVARGVYDEGVHGLLRSATALRGDVTALKLGPFDVVLISRPEHIQHVLVTNADSYTKDDAMLRYVRPAFGNGIFLSEGAVWRSQRRIVQPEFTRKSVSGLVKGMTFIAERIASDWERARERNRPVDVMNTMREAAMRIICHTVMDIDVGEDAERLGRAIDRALGVFGVQLSLPKPLSKLAQPLLERRMAHNIAELDSFIARIIRERNDPDGSDVVSRLRQAKDPETGQPMSIKQLRDELMTLFVAGHETTANAMTWAWLLLAKHPEIQQRVQAELQEVLQGRAPTGADLPKLVFTRAVIDETMRLYPPVPFIPRTALQDDCIGGYRIPAGTIVLSGIYVTHHRDDVFSNPERFVPERFLSNARESTARHGNGYLPFGAGPRLCMGNHFAIAEAQVLLATLAQRFSVEVRDRRRMRPARMPGTLRPSRPVYLHLQ